MRTPEALLDVLTPIYDAVVALLRPQLPSTIPALQAITQPTFAAVRTVIGDVNGEIGPRCLLVSGKSTAMDGSQGVFAWDPNSVASDDNTNILQPGTLARGRWRRVV